MRRIIVCGCRDWTNVAAVTVALDCAVDEDHEAVVVHGGCETGADAIAAVWARGVVKTEVYRANWRIHGNSAGPIRNQEMANLGATLCLAFWDGNSRGTLDMITRATAAGIPVRIVPKERA